MNYFAHGMRFVDRPYFLVGTAIPDWMSVVDRRVRLRSKFVQPFAVETGTPESELAAGILQHLSDDGWFHKTSAFAIASAELTILFRDALPADEGHRPSFLGHILTEMLLDAALIDQQPDLLSRYYDAFANIDAGIVETAINQMVKVPTDRLHGFIPLFVRERFLTDYGDPARLLYRLNQVLRRVGLTPLPAGFDTVLVEARGVINRHRPGLLPGW
jgi:hypothetical protein